MRGGEVDLRHLRQTVFSEFPDYPPTGLHNVRRSEWQSEPYPLRETPHLLELPRPRQYRRSSHGRVVLSTGTHLQSHVLRHERLEIGAGRPGKLIYNYYFNLVHKFTHDRGVELAEQPVDVSGGGSPGLVLRRGERNDVDVAKAYGFQDAS